MKMLHLYSDTGFYLEWDKTLYKDVYLPVDDEKVDEFTETEIKNEVEATAADYETALQDLGVNL